MGSRYASIHLRCDDSTEVLALLAEAFGKKKLFGEENSFVMDTIRAYADKIGDPKEKAEKEAALAQLMQKAQSRFPARDSAAIVVREHFVSIYWYDHIRIENLQGYLLKYAALCNVSALGVSLFDDTNFSIYAVRNAGKKEVKGCKGVYMFDYDDINPVRAEDICNILYTPFYLEGLKKTLRAQDGETMAETFEKETGLPLYMDIDLCNQYAMKKLYVWKYATVFQETK